MFGDANHFVLQGRMTGLKLKILSTIEVNLARI